MMGVMVDLMKYMEVGNNLLFRRSTILMLVIQSGHETHYTSMKTLEHSFRC